jgi:hypothetical protein
MLNGLLSESTPKAILSIREKAFKTSSLLAISQIPAPITGYPSKVFDENLKIISL